MNFDFAGMMSKAKDLKENLGKMKETLQNISVEGESGGGLVKVVASCDLKVRKIEVEPQVEGDREMMQDLIVAAVNNALEKAKEKSSEEMNKVTGGLGNIPGFGV